MRRGFPSSWRGRALVLTLGAALAAPAAAAPDKNDQRAEDEAFVQKLLEIIEKTVAQAENDELDRTPYASLDDKDKDVAIEIVRRLDGQRVSLNFEDTSFADAIEFIRELTGLNVVLSRHAKDVVEASSAKLKLKLKDIKVRNALELVMTQTDANLRYGVRNGVLEIGTVEDWKGKNMILDVIPIDDIIYRPPDFPAPEAGLDALRPKKGIGGR